MAKPLKLRSGKTLVPAQSSQSNQNHENAKSSPLWLKGYEPSIATNNDTFVGFAEYLRWMRSPDAVEKNLANSTKVEILQLAAKKSDSYKNRLEVLTSRTKRIAGEKNTFEVTSTWRIRVGGQRGPESMLLPAWDALGIPYIPSSTLRGVARDRSIREFIASGMSYEQATKAIAPYFGSIDSSTPKADRMGKVVFLDAYPLSSDSGALAVDLANNIWKWKDNLPKYGAQPFALLSLVKPTFVIGIKPTQKCDDQTFNKIKDWLIAGLQSGLGSQVNSGYGELLVEGGENSRKEILRTNFILEGQLIHGVQKIISDQKHPQSQAEVRPIAFRAMLRYWFRAFALGVLPCDEVKDLEAKLFGSIQPTLSNPKKSTQGWVSVHIIENECKPSTPNLSGKQSGTLILRYSNSAPVELYDSIYKLCQNLTWLCFNLGGVGQGARRPLHQRSSYPTCRGSRLQIINKESQPMSFNENLFQKSFQDLYLALGDLAEQRIDYKSLMRLSTNQSDIVEAIDANCCILICREKSNTNKPHSLGVLHSQETKGSNEYKKLCGEMQKPSPVWVCDKGKYQVVTVFGANTNPRKKYVEKLLANSNTIQIFPIQ
jgi:CRISPR-associated protein Cmr6